MVSGDVPGTSIRMTGVRPGRRTVSIERPSMGRPRLHSSMRAAALSMWPCADQSGSKAGDLAGISM
jgi:hypothetical protein